MRMLLLVEGDGVTEERLKSISLRGAKQVVIGRDPGLGMIVHVGADHVQYLNGAVSKFAELEGVTAVTVLAIRV